MDLTYYFDINTVNPYKEEIIVFKLLRHTRTHIGICFCTGIEELLKFPHRPTSYHHKYLRQGNYTFVAVFFVCICMLIPKSLWEWMQMSALPAIHSLLRYSNAATIIKHEAFLILIFIDSNIFISHNVCSVVINNSHLHWDKNETVTSTF